MLVVIVGMPCAGKTTVLSVCEDMGADTVTSGDIIREEVKRRGLEYNRENDRKVAKWFHEEDNEEVLVEKVLDRMDSDPAKEFVAVEGLRDPGQLEVLEERTGVSPIIVAVEAPFQERVDRCVARERFPREDEDFLRQRDEEELERGLGEVIEMADYHFNTAGRDIHEVKEDFREFMEKVMEDVRQDG